MDKVATSGTMDRCTTVNGSKTKSTEKAFMFGLMADDMKVSGRTTTCTARESTPGKMAESTKVNT